MILFNELVKLKSKYDAPQPIVDGLYKHIPEIVNDVEFATNSVYKNGNIDELGRYLPYYNMINFRLNVAVRSTDIDLKDIDIVSDSPDDVVKSKVARKEFYQWAKERQFGKTLNDLVRKRAKYGGVIAKKVYDEDGNIDVEAIDWRNIIIDQHDLLSQPIIERHYLSPLELSKKIGVWYDVEDILEECEDDDEDTIEIWEVSGEFTKETLKQAQEKKATKKDKYEYSLQKHIVYVKDDKPKYILWSEEIDELPYKYISYQERDGFTLGIGIVEESLEAQRVINNYVISQYNAVELAGKTVMVSDSDSLNKANAFSNILNGEVLKISRGESISALNLSPSAFPAFSGLIEQWDRQAERSTSTYEAVTGETMPSGTPFRSVAIQNQEGNSTFTHRIEEFGFFVEEIINDWIMPELLKKVNREHILSGNYSPEELQAFDENIAYDKANKKVLQDIADGKITYKEDYLALVDAQVQAKRQLGEQRFLDITKGYFKGFKGYASVHIGSEKKDKQAILDSLSNILLQVAQAPQILQDPTLFKIFSQIVELSGADISPVDLKPSVASQTVSPEEQALPQVEQ